MRVLSCYFALKMPRLIERRFDCRCGARKLRLPEVEARVNEQVPTAEVDGIVVRNRPGCNGAIPTRRANVDPDCGLGAAEGRERHFHRSYHLVSTRDRVYRGAWKIYRVQVGSRQDRGVLNCFLHEKDIDEVPAKNRCRQSLADCKPANKRSTPITPGSGAQTF
jgi:hypothetical protein